MDYRGDKHTHTHTIKMGPFYSFLLVNSIKSNSRWQHIKSDRWFSLPRSKYNNSILNWLFINFFVRPSFSFGPFLSRVQNTFFILRLRSTSVSVIHIFYSISGSLFRVSVSVSACSNHIQTSTKNDEASFWFENEVGKKGVYCKVKVEILLIH